MNGSPGRKMLENAQSVKATIGTEKNGNEIPYGYCKCGCGQKTNIYKGIHRSFIKCHSHKVMRQRKAELEGPLEDRFWSKVDMRSPFECWPWVACVRRKNEGYGAFWFNRKYVPASRMVWLLLFDMIPNEIHVCHHCDNPNCCNPEHLFIGTHLDNNNDKVNKNRHVFGERVNTTKLSEKQVIRIRALIKAGARQVSIAKTFGIGQAQVSSIKLRKSWKHL